MEKQELEGPCLPSPAHRNCRAYRTWRTGVSAPWTGTKPGSPEREREQGWEGAFLHGVGVGRLQSTPGLTHLVFASSAPFPSAKVAWEPGSFLPASS